MLELSYHENQTDQLILDREPLLISHHQRSEEYTSSSNDISVYIKDYYQSRLTSLMDNAAAASPTDDEATSKSTYRPTKKTNTDIDDNLVGLFVVSFDTKLGNIIEWQIPTSLNLTNIEFKAMASGFHLIERDFVYFSKDEQFGLAAFERVKIDNSEERNIRMKSVGMIANSYQFLRHYAIFLKNQVKYQLEMPNSYKDLISLWENKQLVEKIPPCITENPEIQSPILSENSLIDKIFSKRLSVFRQISSIAYPNYRLFSKFALYFGPSIFVIWRYVLLNKRVLFFSNPPISDLCSRVFGSIQMLSTSFDQVRQRIQLKPYFYVNVTDIDALKQEPFYLACTTEKIFESKEFLYDLFVADALPKSVGVLAESHRNLMKVNSVDKKRYDALLKKICDLPLSKQLTDTTDDEDEKMFIEFFTAENDRIFGVLTDASNAESETQFGFERSLNDRSFNLQTTSKTSSEKSETPNFINSTHMKKMGLDPTDDKDFINEIIRFYDFNLILN